MGIFCEVTCQLVGKQVLYTLDGCKKKDLRCRKPFFYQ